MSDIERLKAIENELEALREKAEKLDSRTSSSAFIGPPDGLWPHEEKAFDKALDKDLEKYKEEIKRIKENRQIK